jgi:hypothetical protein
MFFFALDRVQAFAPQHPEGGLMEPFSSLRKGDQALDEAPTKGWTVMNMKYDWKPLLSG